MLRPLLLSASLFATALVVSDATADDVHVTVNGIRQVAETSRADLAEPPPPPCTEDCFVLSRLTLRGSVSDALTFELRGSVRAKQETKIPLFGPPGQVHLDELTIDGAPATALFDSDQYYLYTSARSFTVRGKITLGSDQILSVPGPVVGIDASLTKGKLVEGTKLSGVVATVLHFDPMIDGAEAPKPPPVFRLSRALRVGRETTFVYRLVASQATDLGTIRLPLKYGEKVQDAQGTTGWTVEGRELLLPTSGKEAEITVSGTIPQPKSFAPDERSAYEWLLVEADPEHLVNVSGDAKLVETGQSPIPPSMPGARVYLLQRGQHLDVEARSLARGDVLAAVARKHERFVAITGAGELISDELITYENNGLDHLALTPAGKPVYLSNDGNAQRILHDDAMSSKDVLVPVATGEHRMRVQTLSNVTIWPLMGVLSIPPSTYPLATSAVDTTVGLPADVHPIAVFGGDRARWGLGRGDLFALALGIALACFGFREKKTRAIGALATAGLWFVSRDGFVVAGGVLAVAGSIFLASRFLRGNKLLVASGFIVSIGMLAARAVLASSATGEPTREMFVEDPKLPAPETHSYALARSALPGDITPVSLSMPTSERYVASSRQVVSKERPFVPRVVYVTSTLVGLFHLGWLALVSVLVWSHRDKLAALKAKIVERLARRPESAPPVAQTVDLEAPPF